MVQNTVVLDYDESFTDQFVGHVELTIPIPNDDLLDNVKVIIKNYRQPYGLTKSGGSIRA